MYYICDIVWYSQITHVFMFLLYCYYIVGILLQGYINI